MAAVTVVPVLDRALKALATSMGRAGYTVDTRWLEQHVGECAVCQENGVPFGTLDVALAPQAAMGCVPYVVCRSCVDRYRDPGTGQIRSSVSIKAGAAVLRSLGINPERHWLYRFDERLKTLLAAMMEDLSQRGVQINDRWLQERTLECPGCGTPLTLDSAHVGCLEAEFEGRGVVGLLYLRCEGCQPFRDPAARERILHTLVRHLDPEQGEPQ